MKNLPTTSLVLLLVIALVACKKSNVNTSASLTGKWNITVDSLSSGVIQVTNKVYNGTSGDYFDFRTDNKLYIKEGNTLDTVAYSVLSTSTVIIQTFGVNANGVYPTSNVNVSANAAVISTPNVASPGGYYRRAVHLTR